MPFCSLRKLFLQRVFPGTLSKTEDISDIWQKILHHRSIGFVCVLFQSIVI